MTSPKAFPALSALLYVLSLVEAAAGIALIFASGWVISLVLATPPGSDSGFLLALMKSLGVLCFGLAYLMCCAARDPVRYLAVIDTLAFLLLGGAILSFYSLSALSSGTNDAGTYLIARGIIQVVLAVILVALRPKGDKIDITRWLRASTITRIFGSSSMRRRSQSSSPKKTVAYRLSTRKRSGCSGM